MKKIFVILLTISIVALAFSVNIFAEQKDKITDVTKGGVRTGIYYMPIKYKPIVQTYISRIEFMSQLDNILGIKLYYFAAPDISKVFSDVKSDNKYANQLYDMYSVGIIDDKDTFRPNDKLTREEAIHYIVKAYNYGINSMQVVEGIGGKQTKLINRGYLKDVPKAQKLGLVGKEKLSLLNKPITRAEVLSLIKRLEKLLNTQKFQQNEKNIIVKPTYSYNNEGLKLTAEVVNNSKKNVTLDFNSGHQIDFILLDGLNNEIYNSSTGIMFIQALTKVELSPGESKVYSEELLYSDRKEIIDNAAAIKVKIFGTINGKEVKEETVRFVRFLGPPIKKPADLDTKSWAKLGQQGLEMSAVLTNNSDRKISFYYQPGKLYDFVLYDENKNEIYR